ncbi:MAG: FAD-dependent monooxygenase [Rhodoferax sp.]
MTPNNAAGPSPASTHASLATQVAIIGAGPSGLMLAIELGCRGVPCILLDVNPTAPTSPKANATSARTMEHYRRRGFAHRVRSAGLAADHPHDVMYCTRLMGHELARFRIPSRAQAAAQSDFGDYGAGSWPTPELPQRAQQFYVEAILRDELAKYPSVTTLYGWRADDVAQSADAATVAASRLAGSAAAPSAGETATITARYAVGCDGARSIVRKAIGAQFEGASKEQREFFGGEMLGIQFRSPDLYECLKHGPLKGRAWQSWVVNPVQRGILVAINGVDDFSFGIQLKPGQAPDSVDVDQTLRALVADPAQPVPFSYTVTGRRVWTAGYTLVANQYHAGRLFIAGDAAHLFTPTGGMGYNTAVDDAVNLGWKLAAVCQGWAPAALLESYFAERQPIAQRNTRFARAMADSIGKAALPATMEQDSAEGEEGRHTVGAAMLKHCHAEFNIPGLQLGLRYQSPIVAKEAGEPPVDLPNRYEPSAYPGCRAPHVATATAAATPKGQSGSLLDAFHIGFTLLTFSSATDTTAWLAAAKRRGIPMGVVCHSDPAAHAVYGADCVLIRPDHHIAWRSLGQGPAPDERAALQVLDMATGQAG